MIHLYLTAIFFRPHDRVALKEMKADWHSCLDNKVGFKVSQTYCSINFSFIKILQPN